MNINRINNNINSTKMKTRNLFRLLAITIIALFTVNSYAQYTVMVGDNSTYSINAVAGHVATGDITYHWNLTGTGAGTLSSFGTVGDNSVSIAWTGDGNCTLEVYPEFNCSYNDVTHTKTATITILPATTNIQFGTNLLASHCSSNSFNLNVTSSFNMMTGNSYELEVSVDGGIATWITIAYTSGTTAGTIPLTIPNTGSGNILPSIVISNFRINTGTNHACSGTTTVNNQTITAEPILDVIY
jgi:hypothetical protein